MHVPPLRGACHGKPVSWFYPDARLKVLPPEAKQAIKLCNSCEHRVKCSEYALRFEVYGIWGGLTELQRELIRKRRGIAVRNPGTSTQKI